MTLKQTQWIRKMVLPLIIIILFVMAFLFGSISDTFEGYLRILTSPSVLISDYLYIGGLSATLFNVATIMLLNLVMIKILDLKLNGPIFAGILTIAGFSFFGKNLFNTLPIYLGIYLYSKFAKTEFKSLIVVILFSTGISPLVSFVIFGTGWAAIISVSAGLLIGVITGFILPALAKQTLKFHQGYNLYNVGFAMGILSTVFAAIFKSMNLRLDLGGPSSTEYHSELIILCLILSIIFIVSAFIFNPNVLKNYKKILKTTGQLGSDYISNIGKAESMLNVGIMGLLSLLVIVIFKFTMGGALMGAVLTVMGFAAYGKHPFNSVPVIAGALLGVWMTNYDFNSVGVVISILFVTALAPISGKYGPVAGIIAGLIHVVVAPMAFTLQGGFDLYNNGFTAGFIAAFLVPIFQIFKKEEVINN